MRTQNGLTLVEILISVGIVAALGIAGFYLFANKDSRSAVNINEQPTTSSAVPAPGFENVDEMIVSDEFEEFAENESLETPQVIDSTDLATECPDNFTAFQSQGPYYKTGSPERQSLVEERVTGEKITVTGFVFAKNCEPITNVWLDFWQADSSGNYDNQGFRLRGHQYTNDDGLYTLETVIPAQYSSRPPHIHLKLQSEESDPVLTTQLYFPGQRSNNADVIFNPALVVSMSDDGKTAHYNFKIDTD